MFLSEEFLKDKKYGKLRVKDCRGMFSGSAEKIFWVCDCGKEKLIKANHVFSGRITSCNRCNEILAADICGKKFGKLKIKIPQNLMPGSAKKIAWVCDCGKEKNASINRVLDGHTHSCGRCNEISAKDISGKKFGRLTIKIPQKVLTGSAKKVMWVCDCGNDHEAVIHSVIRGSTRSCGKCGSSLKNWYEQNKKELLELKTPINPDDIPDGLFSINNSVSTTKEKIDSNCSLCGKKYSPYWHNVRRGVSLSCGCVTNSKVSNSQLSLYNLLKSMEENCILEYKLDDFFYDMFIPSKSLLVEFHGLRWHSFDKSRKYDLLKYQIANERGFELVSIYEDELLLKRDFIQNYFLNKLGLIDVKLRPSEVLIKSVSLKEVNSFYEKYHYIGKCKARIHYAVYHNDHLVSSISFGRPTRQTSKYDWEIIRMASKNIRIHGIWSKLLKLFVKEHSPKSIVSFSDNRLFSGKVYERLGFEYDGEVRPDYYWTKGNRRFHKSGLRKTKLEKLTEFTETQLRESQGYKKIWDLGKKRWVFNAS